MTLFWAIDPLTVDFGLIRNRQVPRCNCVTRLKGVSVILYLLVFYL